MISTTLILDDGPPLPMERTLTGSLFGTDIRPNGLKTHVQKMGTPGLNDPSWYGHVSGTESLPDRTGMFWQIRQIRALSEENPGILAGWTAGEHHFNRHGATPRQDNNPLPGMIGACSVPCSVLCAPVRDTPVYIPGGESDMIDETSDTL